MEENNEVKKNKIHFPCGLEIQTEKELIKELKEITCPLHGRDCWRKRISLVNPGEK